MAINVVLVCVDWMTQLSCMLCTPQKQIRDRLTLLELRGRLLLAVGDLSGAEAVYRWVPPVCGYLLFGCMHIPHLAHLALVVLVAQLYAIIQADTTRAL